MQPLAFGQDDGMLVGGLEIVALLDQPRPKPDHRPVLLDAVAMRYHDRGGEAEAGGGIGDALPVIAAGSGHHPAQLRLGAPDLVEIDEPAAQFERADRGVVLVLDPNFGPDPTRQ